MWPRIRQFAFGVAAGLTAQGLRALWRWLKDPVTAPTAGSR